MATSEKYYSQIVDFGSNLLNQGLGFLENQTETSLQELAHASSDPSNYLKEQYEKLNFSRPLQSTPFNKNYHVSKPASKNKSYKKRK